MQFLSSVLFMWWIIFIDLHMLNQACIRGMKPTIMMDKLFDVLLDLVCQYFIKDFCINIHRGYWPEIFFFSCVSARFWYQYDVGLIK